MLKPRRRSPNETLRIGSWSAAVALAIGTGTGTGVHAQDPAPVTERAGAHFRVVCHFDDVAAARQALAVVEACWTAAAPLYGLERHVPAEPMHINLYRDPAAYVAAEARITRGRFRRNLAFAHWQTRTAHVAVQPPVDDAVLGSHGLPFQTLRLLVHEAAHLVRYEAMPNYRYHPQWLADGAASWLETRVLTDAVLMKGPEQDPRFSTATRHVQEAVNSRGLTATDVLDDAVEPLDFYARYAARWMLFRYLHEREGAALRKMLTDMRRFGGGSGYAARVRASLARHLGARGADGLNASFAAWVDDLSPRWAESSRSLETAGDDWVQTAFPGRDALTWRVDETRSGTWELRGAAAILTDGGAAHVALRCADDRHLVLVLEHGSVSAQLRGKSGNETLATAQASDIRRGARTAFTVEVRRGGVTLRVGDRRLLHLDELPALSGQWGVGTKAGATVVWRGVRGHR